MDIIASITVITVLLLLTLLGDLLAARWRVPAVTLLVCIGFIGSEIVVALGFDTRLRAENFQQLVFFVFLPALIFTSALEIDLTLLRRHLGTIALLAIIGMLLTASLIAVCTYYGIGHATGFPWIAALITGAMLAATDPSAVIHPLQSLGAPRRLAILLEGESLFNDATAVVLFAILLSIALQPGEPVSALQAVGRFGFVFLGGVLAGCASGLLFAWLARRLPGTDSAALLSIVCAYGTFLMADLLLHVSGVMAVLVAGLIFAHRYRLHSADEKKNTEGLWFFWQTLGSGANGLLFVIAGATITVSMFSERWLAMLIGIGAVLLARASSVTASVALARLFGAAPLPAAQQGVMVWGGWRGAITLALALSLPVELDYWWTIQSIAFGVVLFTLFVQAPTMGWLMGKLKLTHHR